MNNIYQIKINDEPKIDVYRKLIDYAIDKSDVFMLIVRYDFAIDQEVKILKKEAFQDEKKYLEYLSIVTKMKMKNKKDIEIFKNQTEFFLKKLQPHLIKKRKKPTKWPSTEIFSDEHHSKIHINLYKICEEIKELLHEPNGLYEWIYPYLPEDLCFFKDGYCWFSTCSHEKLALIYLNNIEEVEKLKNIHLKVSICKDSDIKLFYEKYNKIYWK